MDGVLLIDKPAGRTSHDVVNEVRRTLPSPPGRKAAKVGHAGTLDPFATGLLLVLLGRATRAQRFLMGLDKAYEVVARFGAVSSTGDPEGDIVEVGPQPAAIPDPLVLPTGRVTQRPPVYSAVKIGGERAYRLARRGEDVAMPERTVTVTRFEERWRDPPRAGLFVECSSGTYVRSLVADLGDAYCEALRRTAIGPFGIEAAGVPGEAEPLALGDALARVLPVVRLAGDAARRAGHGVAIQVPAHAAHPAEAAPPTPGGHVLLVDADGPIAVAEPREGGLLKPTVGFRA